MARGRSQWDAPEIDGAVYVSSRRPLRPGEIVTVKIERADAYDLHGSWRERRRLARLMPARLRPEWVLLALISAAFFWAWASRP